MPANEVVRARIDPHVKHDAAAVLATMGMTISDAFRIRLTRVAREKVVPLDFFMPNATTIAAMDAAERGEVRSVSSVEALMLGLDAEDLPHEAVRKGFQA